MFILNGNYDSNDFIRKSRYGKFVDGYRVLRSEANKLTLDIDWTGFPPTGDALSGNSINIWVVRTKSEFDYLDSILVDLYDTRCSKFEYRITSNVIYTENLVFTNQFFIKGFWAKDGNTWKLISTHFDQGFINYFLPKNSIKSTRLTLTIRTDYLSIIKTIIIDFPIIYFAKYFSQITHKFI